MANRLQNIGNIIDAEYRLNPDQSNQKQRHRSEGHQNTNLAKNLGLALATLAAAGVCFYWGFKDCFVDDSDKQSDKYQIEQRVEDSYKSRKFNIEPVDVSRRNW